jgi:ribosomal-protein-alanine N-acetyltransferase
MTVLTTARLALRRLDPSDAAALHAICHEPGLWDYFAGRPPASVEDARATIEKHQAYYQQHGFGFWATVLRETGELIGRCGLLSQVVDGRTECEIAYMLSPRFWGRGLAAEAARGIRDWAFRSLACDRLISIIHPDNIASKRVAIAAGLCFSHRTRFREVEVDLYAVEMPGRSSDEQTSTACAGSTDTACGSQRRAARRAARK